MKCKDCLEVIEAAEKGFPITDVVRYCSSLKDTAKKVVDNPDTAKKMADKDK